jgi:hypothetical protein
MTDIEATSTLIATVLGVLVGLLPVGYITWRESLLKDTEQQAREFTFKGGIGKVMHDMGIKKIHFSGIFRFRNYEVITDITEISDRLKRQLPKGASVSTSNSPSIYTDRVASGLDEITLKCQKRGILVFDFINGFFDWSNCCFGFLHAFIQ